MTRQDLLMCWNILIFLSPMEYPEVGERIQIQAIIVEEGRAISNDPSASLYKTN
ncbi:hypothetical protein [Rhizobium sp. AC27/96]|uniref:hypothetical protein n=1 Tax=Rhizobium sp. AC27/96 TaxID=1841653 RepID=UPI0013017EB7|nr:hypothetical protein [Rhizobium sp. AC27/96]